MSYADPLDHDYLWKWVSMSYLWQLWLIGFGSIWIFWCRFGFGCADNSCVGAWENKKRGTPRPFSAALRLAKRSGAKPQSAIKDDAVSLFECYTLLCYPKQYNTQYNKIQDNKKSCLFMKYTLKSNRLHHIFESFPVRWRLLDSGGRNSKQKHFWGSSCTASTKRSNELQRRRSKSCFGCSTRVGSGESDWDLERSGKDRQRWGRLLVEVHGEKVEAGEEDEEAAAEAATEE